MFDKNYKVMDVGWQVVPTTAKFARQKITLPTINVKEAGYLFTYLSYEDQSNNFVYFDDYKVTYTPTNIVQYNEYYPYGLQTATSWTRENSTGNNFLGNGGTELNATSGLYDLEYRNYDPALARMHQVDPMADKYASYTPYNYSFNAPSNFNDRNGAEPLYENLYYYNRAANTGSIANARIIDTGTFGGGHITPGSGGNWSDSYRPIYANMGLMSQSTFLNYYGINDNQSRFDAGLQMGQSNGARIDGLRAQQLWSYYSDGYSIFYGMTSMGRIQSIYTAKLNVTITSTISSSISSSDPFIESFNEFRNFFFKDQVVAFKNYRHDWVISYSMSDNDIVSVKRPGATALDIENGRILTYIHFSTLADPALLYLTIGHELIHARDHENGNSLVWSLEYPDHKDIIMENHAYLWDAKMEQGLGVHYFATENLKSSTALMPSGFKFSWYK